MARMVVALLSLAPASSASPSIPDRAIVLHDHQLKLHFSRGERGADHPLLVYATGDGGWHRKDVAAYDHLVTFGYPTVGFDAHDYVKHLGSEDDHARHAWPRTTSGSSRRRRRRSSCRRTILSSSSACRAAPGCRSSRPASVGCGRRSPASSPSRSPGRGVCEASAAGVAARPGREMVQVYDYLPRLANMPIAVVQSTRDHYLPAAAARALFGPDTPYRWFQPVEAHNHSFGGARDQLYDAMDRSLTWLVRVHS